MSRRYLLLAAGVILAVYLFVASRSTLFDRDEPRFARAGIEMVRSGNYLYATFNGAVRPDKPILIYWLMSLPLRLFGESTLACRLWSPIGGAVAALLTGLLAWRLCGRRAGLLAMVMLATSPLTIISGTAATVDAVLLALVVGSVLGFAHALEKGASVWHYAVLAVLTIAAMLLKGPAGLLVPLFVIPVVWWLARRQTPLRWTYLLGIAAVLVIGVACFAAWAIPANNATKGIVLGSGIGTHVVGRALHPMEGHGSGYWTALPYYLFAILLAFFPWTLYLPAAISAVLGGRLCHRLARPLLIGWAVPVFLLVTAVATKLPHYALPIWPALAVASAGVLMALERNLLTARDLTWLRRGVWFVLPVGLLLAAAFIAGPPRFALTAIQTPALICGVIILLMTALALWQHLRGRVMSGTLVLAGGMTLFWLTVGTILMPAVEHYKLARPLATSINQQFPSLPVALYEYNEPSMIFYLGRNHVPVLDTAEAVAMWTRSPRPVILIAPRAELQKIVPLYGGLQLQEVAAAKGFGFGGGKRADLVAVRAGGTAAQSPPGSPAP